VKVLIRADASLAIGSGHVMRCLTLARGLQERGAEVTFACRELPGHALAQVTAAGFNHLALPAHYPGESPVNDIEHLIAWQADLAALQQLAAGMPTWDWLLLDHYGLDAQWQHGARTLAHRIAVIDDLANRPHDADLLIDQNLTANLAAYTGLLPAGCRCLLGPRYALLRPEFATPAAAPRPRVARVLVNFGGVDASGETLKAMEALEGLSELTVDFVAGAANPAWNALQVRAQGQPNWHLHRHVTDFATLMRQADLFIGAGGGTSWERAALGLPTLCIAVAANQVANAQKLAEAGVHAYLGPAAKVGAAGLRQAVVALIPDQARRQGYADRSRALVDGQGVRRVAAAFATAALQLRLATAADDQLLFDGRNAELVRRWSLNPEPIVWEAHLGWLAATLARSDRVLLIGEGADGPVGVLRYDRHPTQSERAEVSIYLFAGNEGMGWGAALLAAGDAWVASQWPGLKAIDATVLPGNTASLKLFQQAGYRQSGDRFERTL